MGDNMPRKVTLLVENQKGETEIFTIPVGYNVSFIPEYSTDMVPMSSPRVLVPEVAEINIRVGLGRRPEGEAPWEYTRVPEGGVS